MLSQGDHPNMIWILSAPLAQTRTRRSDSFLRKSHSLRIDVHDGSALLTGAMLKIYLKMALFSVENTLPAAWINQIAGCFIANCTKILRLFVIASHRFFCYTTDKVM